MTTKQFVPPDDSLSDRAYWLEYAASLRAYNRERDEEERQRQQPEITTGIDALDWILIGAAVIVVVLITMQLF